MLFEQPVQFGSTRAEQPVTYSAAKDFSIEGELPLSVETSGVKFDAEPGGQTPYTLTVQRSTTNLGGVIDETKLSDENLCRASNLGNGYRLIVQVNIDGRSVEQVEWCVPYGGFTFGEPPNRELNTMIDLPETPGEYEIEARIIGANTGEYFGSVTESIDLTTADTGDGGGSESCPDGFVLDPETGNCVEAGGNDDDDDGDDNDENGPSGCTLADAVNPANSCTLADATGAVQLAGAGAVLMLFLIVVLAVGR